MFTGNSQRGASTKLALQYGIALLATGAALGLRVALDPLVGGRVPFFTFIIATVFVAWVCDSGPTLFTILAGGALGIYTFVAPRFGFKVETTPDWANLLAFLAVTMSILLVSRRYKSTLKDLRQTLRDKDTAEQMLRDQEQRLRLSQEAAAAGSFDWDVRADTLRWTPELELVYGMTAGSFAGRLSDWQALVHPEDRALLLRHLHNSVAGQRGIHHEFRIVRPNGEVRWMGMHARVVLDGAGRAERMIGIQLDITERKNAEEQLRKSEERLRLANLAAGVATWDWDLMLDRVYWSPEYFRVLGLAPDTPMIVAEWRKQIHPDDQPMVGDAVRQAIKSAEKEFRLECRVVPREGFVRWIHTRATIFRNPEGRAVRIVGVSVDISDRKDVEERLRESGQRLQSALLAGQLAGWDWDLGNNVVRWFSEVPALHGMTTAADSGFWDRNIHPDDRERLQSAIEVAVREEHSFECEFRLVRPDGAVHWLASRGDVVRDDHGQPVRALGVSYDITERRRAEEALRVAEKFATAGRMAAALSHEINNPLEAVTNIMYLLRTDGELTSRLRELVSTADRELARVAHIVRQSLSFYREDTRPTPVTLHSVIEEVLALYERRIRQAGVTVDARYDFRGEIPVIAGELRQVISNLVINALDVLPNGGRLRLRVGAASDWRNGGERRARITIADNGPGIPAELKQHLCQPFFTTKGEKGTGLGLWVTAGILNKYGGSLRVRSSTREGASGAVFCAYLPCEPKMSATAAAGATERVA